MLRINPPKFGGGLKFEPVEAKRRSRSAGTPELDKRGRFAEVSPRNSALYMRLKTRSGLAGKQNLPFMDGQ